MKKNKGLFLVLVALLAVTCLLVSCNSEVTSKAEAGEGKLVYATFGNESKATRPTVSSMTQSYSVDGIDDVYWVYTATKDDAYGTHGQQTSYVRVNETKGLAGAIGPFSKGYWNFSLKGYKYVGSGDDTTTATTVDFSGNNYRLVFVGSVSHFLLSDDNTASTATPISVTVYLQTDGGAGTLTVSNNFKFFWADDATTSSGDLKLKVYLDDSSSETILADLAYNAATTDPASDAYYSLSNAVSNNTVTAGDHTLKAKVVRVIDNADMVYFEGTLPVKIYSGQETVVDMNLLEGQFVWGEFNGTVDLNSVVVATSTTKIFETSSSTATFTVNYTPASNGTATNSYPTTVVFNNANQEESSVTTGDINASYKLGVTVSNVEAAQSKFTVANDTSAVAAIDLNLTKTVGTDDPVSVTEFNGGQIATVTTYITKNLNDAKVFYNGLELEAVTEAPAQLNANTAKYTYTPGSGELIIYTNHFSEFYVTSSDKVYNANLGTVYNALSDALSACRNGDTIIILNDISLPSSNTLNKSITLDLNGHTITSDATLFNCYNNYNLVIKDSGTNGSINCSASKAIYFSGGNLRIEGGAITVHSTSTYTYGVQVGSSASFEMTGGSITIPSSSTSTYNYCVSNQGNATISGGTFVARASGGNYTIGQSSGTMNISGGVFDAYAYPAGFKSPYVLYITGGTLGMTGGYVRAFGDKGSYSAGYLVDGSGSVSISGGYFGGNYYYSLDSSARVADGYQVITPSDNPAYRFYVVPVNSNTN